MGFGYDLACPTKPTDCSSQTVVIASSSSCITAWDIRSSEIKRVFLAPYDGTFTPPIATADMETLLTWTDLIDNASVTPPFVRELYVSAGDMPVPDKNTFTIKNQVIVKSKNYTVNFDLLDVNATNYTLSRDFDNNKLAWVAYETDGGSLFGWMLMLIDSDIDLARGEDSNELIKFVATMTEECKPPRYDSPFA